LVTSGPISAALSVDGPIFSSAIFGASLSTSASATASVTGTATEIAMQRSPAEPKAAPISAEAAMSRSASGMMTMWFFAPPSACTRLPCAVPVE
jgi:hypothetical protein